jgi:hypothetical protein
MAFVPQSGHLMEEESQEELNTYGNANIVLVGVFRCKITKKLLNKKGEF